MPEPSPLLHALLAACPDAPPSFIRFDAIARGLEGAADPGPSPVPGPRPSFEEYSLRLGQTLNPWRQTCYFDVGGDPSLAAVANARFAALAEALGFAVPPAFLAALTPASASASVLQIVLGFDAAGERSRLKYYLIFRDRSGASVEGLRAALGIDPLPPALDPDSVYILGVDFRPAALSDFKLYVRLDPARTPRVIRNLRAFADLWRGSRYLVFQHCMLGPGRQVYFHGSSAELLEGWLGRRRAAETVVEELMGRQLPAMNRALAEAGHRQRLRPWIASLPWDQGQLEPGPSNVYFHFSD